MISASKVFVVDKVVSTSDGSEVKLSERLWVKVNPAYNEAWKQLFGDEAPLEDPQFNEDVFADPYLPASADDEDAFEIDGGDRLRLIFEDVPDLKPGDSVVVTINGPTNRK